MRWPPPFCAGALIALEFGCASHSEESRPMRSALDAGNPELAVQALDAQMGLKDDATIPADLDGDAALLLLDRASIHLALSQHARSERDFEASDKAIDYLDLTTNAGDAIGKYIFSDSAGKYVAPPYEKLLLNTLNLLNYLETDDLEGAKVEARRLQVMRTYIAERLGEHEDGIVALSGFLAGYVYERTGDADEALRYYDEAIAVNTFGWLREPIRSLLARGSYRTPRLSAFAGDLPPPPASVSTQGEVLIVIGYGRVPHKIAKRIPIGLALTLFAGSISPANQAAASHLAEQGLVTWVNYPTLGEEQGTYSLPSATLDGRTVVLEQAADVTAEVRRAWHRAEGAIVASAITRMVARFAVGEGARAALGGDSILGVVASLGAQATLTALDRPDTRSWESLPARIAVARVRLPAGHHRVDLAARGASRSSEVDLKEGGYHVVTLFVLR